MSLRGRIQLRGWARWQLRRAQVRRRAGALDHLPIVFGNAIPKNGSKLLFNILRGLPQIGPFVDTGLNSIKPYLLGKPTPQAWITRQLDMLRPGDLRLGYLHATPENLASLCRPGWAVFQIVRDPRDSLVSAIFYATDIHLGHGLHDYYRSIESMEARIAAAIQGIEHGELKVRDIARRYQGYLGWLEQPEVCVLRFEDLIETPELQLSRILDHLNRHGFKPSASRAKALETLAAGMDPAKSETFRKGRSGGWKQHFSTENIAQFKAVTGDLLVRLGYERDMDW